MWEPYFTHMRPFSFLSDGETKYFIDFTDPLFTCNLVTIGKMIQRIMLSVHFLSTGIGGTVDGEKRLMERYPQCEFLGVDPDEKLNRPLVEDIGGRFVKAAVSAKTERRTASVLEGKTACIFFG